MPEFTYLWFMNEPYDRQSAQPITPNQRFWTELELLTKAFGLASTGSRSFSAVPGPAKWHPYRLNDPKMSLDDELVLARCQSLSWEINRELNTPVVEFTLTMIIGQLVSPELLQMYKIQPADIPKFMESGNILTNIRHQLVMQFALNHPLNPPSFFINDRPSEIGTHQHHWHIGGKLCIMHSFSDRLWRNMHYSTVTCLGYPIAWMVWHSRTHDTQEGHNVP